jgi:hypothetical protein
MTGWIDQMGYDGVKLRYESVHISMLLDEILMRRFLDTSSTTLPGAVILATARSRFTSLATVHGSNIRGDRQW